MPKVLNKYKDTLPKRAVYIGRPSKWGNPYVIGADGTRDEVVDKYEEFLEKHPKLMEEARKELAGRDLVCFCSPRRCHGDVLLRIANQKTKRKKDE